MRWLLLLGILVAINIGLFITFKFDGALFEIWFNREMFSRKTKVRIVVAFNVSIIIIAMIEFFIL